MRRLILAALGTAALSAFTPAAHAASAPNYVRSNDPVTGRITYICEQQTTCTPSDQIATSSATSAATAAAAVNAAVAASTGPVSASGGAGGAGGAGGSATSNASGGSSNNSVTVQGDRYREAASTAIGTSIYSSCGTSAGAGASGRGFSGSIGVPFGQMTCQRGYLADQLRAAGFSVEACELLRQDRRVAAAFKASGRACTLPAPTPVTVPPPVIIERYVTPPVDPEVMG